jgi:hypothetical protein
LHGTTLTAGWLGSLEGPAAAWAGSVRTASGTMGETKPRRSLFGRACTPFSSGLCSAGAGTTGTGTTCTAGLRWASKRKSEATIAPAPSVQRFGRIAPSQEGDGAPRGRFAVGVAGARGGGKKRNGQREDDELE